MSRAFVKELDGDQVDDLAINRIQSEYPNYITRIGFDKVKSKLEQMRIRYRKLKLMEDDLSAKSQIKSLEVDIRYLEKRIQCAIPVDHKVHSGEEIRFGATVKLIDENKHNHTFQIVGEDEADAEKGLICWMSPLAGEILGKKAGESLTWKKPSGNLELEIIDFNYE